MPAIRLTHVITLTLTIFPAASGSAQDENGSPPAAAATTDTKPAEYRNRLIYVPFRELRKVLDNEEATAIVPYAEYLKLLQNFLKDQGADDAPEAVITRSDYSAIVDEDVARISLQLDITILRPEGWARLPLSFGTAAVGQVNSDDDDSTILKAIGDGRYELLLRGTGERTVTLELLTTVTTSPESRSFKLECPAVGICELAVTIPEGDQTVRINPVQVLLPSQGSDASKTVVRAALGGTRRFAVHWFPRAGSRPEMDLLASVTNLTSVHVESRLLQTSSKLTWDVLRGELREAVVLVPNDARIIDVVAQEGRIRSWSTESLEGHQQIRIELLNPVDDRFVAEIQAERDPGGDTFSLLGRDDSGGLQGIHAEGVVRESGRISVVTDSSLTLVPTEQSGIRRVSSGRSSEEGPVWEFSGVRGRLTVQVQLVKPRLLARQNTTIIFSDDELRLRSHLDFTVERAGVFELKLHYPEALSIDHVQADGMTEFQVDRTGSVIMIALTNRRLGQIGVDIHGHMEFDAGAENTEVSLPSLQPLNVERSEGSVAVYAPQFLDVVTLAERRAGLTPVRNQQPAAIGRAHPVSVWNFTQQPWTLAVHTSPRPAQVDAIVATTARIEPEIVRIDSRIHLNIRNAGVDTVRLAVPEAIAEDVRFRSLSESHVIQQRNRSQEAEDGWVTWTLVLQSEVIGVVQLAADWETTLTAANGEEVRSTVVEPVRVLPTFPEGAKQNRRVTLTQVHGEIRLLRHESLSIEAETPGESMEVIDVRELEQLPREGYLAFRYFAQPASASVSIRRHEIHEVVATVVSRAAIEVVTEKQPLAAYRCRYRITSSERQRLRIDVPLGSEMQAPLLNNRRTTFEPASDIDPGEYQDAYYVNVSREGQSDETFLLSFQFRCPIEDADRFPYEAWGGTQLLRLPIIGDESGSTVVQETRVAVWTPKDVAVFREPSGWSRLGRQAWSLWQPLDTPHDPHAARSLDDWMEDSAGTADFARHGNAVLLRALGPESTLQASWWNRPFLTSVVSGTLILIGLILRKTSWENRISLVLLAAVAITIWALYDSHAAFHIVSASSMGLLAVAGIWVTGLLLGRAGSSKEESKTPPERGITSDNTGPTPPSDSPDSATSGIRRQSRRRTSRHDHSGTKTEGNDRQSDGGQVT